jgi:arylsulfatase A-like enzyme
VASTKIAESDNSASRAAPAVVPPKPTLPVLLLAIWFGLLTCFAELAILAFQKFALDRLRVLSTESAALLPFAYVGFFALVGISLQLLRLARPRLCSMRGQVIVFATLSAWSLVLLFPRLHPAAGFVLALGVAIEVARRTQTRLTPFRALVLRSILPLAVAAALLSAITGSSASVRERRASARLGAAPSDAPNVLFLILDTVRSMSMSLYGYHRPTTPNLQRIARDGATFERAIATAPWTLPSHASMFTGRFAFELRSGFNLPIRDDYPTLAEVLGREGYATAAFVANVYYASREFKLDRGFARYEDRPLSAGQLVLSFSFGRWLSNRQAVRAFVGYSDMLNRKPASRINHDFLGWLSRQDRERPFFAFLNYYDAHEPYLPPAPFDKRFAYPGKRETYWFDTDRAERHKNQSRAASAVRPQLGAYDGAIAYLDEQIGDLFDELDHRGLLENTLVVITSDHGEEFAEHGEYGHIQNLYTSTIQVPLIITWRGHVPTGVIVREPVSLRDLPATVMSLIGRAGAFEFPGVALSGYWQDGAAKGPRSVVLSEITGFSRRKSIIEGKFHYIRDGDLGDELYDLDADPLERNNLATSLESSATLARLKASLEAVSSRNTQ